MVRQKSLEIRQIDGVTVVRLLDPRTTARIEIEDLEQKLLQLIEAEGQKKVVLNLSSVEFLASATLGKLIALHKKVTARNGIIRLCCLRPEVYELFVVTRLDRLFDIAESETDALAAFGQRSAG
jgi:anti-sigma B factor antagonist